MTKSSILARLLTAATLTACAIAPTVASATTLPEMIAQNPAYQARWKAITADVRATDREIGYVKNLSGPVLPVQTINIEGRRLVVGYVCQISNCNGNNVFAAIEPATGGIWAIHRRHLDVMPRYQFFGNPDKLMKSIIFKQMTDHDERLREESEAMQPPTSRNR